MAEEIDALALHREVYGGRHPTVTFDDPGAFNAPWSGLVRWTNGPIVESVCAENNENYGKFLGLSEYPMPEAKTPLF
jgi:hypothetical protein